jgi:hypothetical protein
MQCVTADLWVRNHAVADIAQKIEQQTQEVANIKILWEMINRFRERKT